MNVGESLLSALKAAGAREIFGIPGDFVLPFFEVIEQSAILPLYTLSHEPAVGFAADAAARIGSRLGVAAVTYGAGALNMVNAVALAYAEKSPLIVISGAPGKHESAAGLSLHHQVRTLDSQMRIYAEITCEQIRIDDAARAPQQIAHALQRALACSQPVYIELPRDMVKLPCVGVPDHVADEVDRGAIHACAREILSRLAAAEHPVLMVGVEVRRFGLEAEVAELAARLALPVVTSFLGRGVLAGTDATVQGTYLGAAGRTDVSALVENSDQLFLLGVIRSDTNFGTAPPSLDLMRAIHVIDGHVTHDDQTWPAIPIAPLVRALLAQAIKGGAAIKAIARGEHSPVSVDNAFITPIDISSAINQAMLRHGKLPIASDIGDCLFTAMEIDHSVFLSNSYYASMGFGVPAGLGIQAATGSRALVLVGDGAFQMTGWELGNCFRHGWDPIVVVLNNSGWGMLRAFQPQSSFNDLGDWHFADIAPSLGGYGQRVTTRHELRDAIDTAFSRRGKFELIEVLMERDALSPTLRRFVSAVKRLHNPADRLVNASA